MEVGDNDGWQVLQLDEACFLLQYSQNAGEGSSIGFRLLQFLFAGKSTQARKRYGRVRSRFSSRFSVKSYH